MTFWKEYFCTGWYNKHEKWILKVAFLGLIVMFIADFLLDINSVIGAALVGFTIGIILTRKQNQKEVAKAL